MVQMRRALDVIVGQGSWDRACPSKGPAVYYLKTQVSKNVLPEELLKEFEDFEVVRLHFPVSNGRGLHIGPAFFEFGTSQARRRAHTKNERCPG